MWIKTGKKIDWVNTLFLTLTPVAAVILTWAHIRFEGFNPWLIIPFFIMYFLTGLSITAGYHRLFSHKAYKAHPVVRAFYLIFGAGTFENSALKWCSDHRVHHQHCDHDKDPYNIQEGFFHAHMGWIMQMDAEPKDPKYPKDLLNDKLVVLQDKYYLPLAIAIGFGLPLLIGFMMGSPIGGLAIVGFFRVVFVHHMTFFINSLCHIVGTRPYTDTNSARDSFIMAFFSYGEGYHNFHHYFQNDYRNGIRWYDFDPTKWLIKFSEKLGLASDLKKTSDEEILKARLHMESKRALEKSAPETSEKIQELLKTIEGKLQQITLLKREMRNLNEERPVSLKEKLAHLQEELKEKISEWSTYCKTSLKVPA